MKTARVITMHYTLTDDSGTVLDSSNGRDPLQYLEGASNIIPGLEKALLSANTGDKKEVKVAAAEAYGEKRDELVLQVPRTQFPADLEIKVGDHFRGGADNNSPIFQVIAIGDAEVTIDGNHPLAGKDLTFAVEITEIRDASEEEMAHGHAHGPHGHHH